jgi:hypothetical protein
MTTNSLDIAACDFVDVLYSPGAEAIGLRFDDDNDRVFELSPSLADDLSNALRQCLHEMRCPKAITPAKWPATRG